MPAIKNKEKILELVDEVPEEKLGKVVSLMEELKKPIKKKIPKKYKAIYDALGKYKDSMPSSEDFLKRKLDDKLLDR